jgi:hypothetical protein
MLTFAIAHASQKKKKFGAAVVGAAMRYECELEDFQMRDGFYYDVINRHWYYQFLNIIIFLM